jgi:hypothetical protein
VSDGCSRLTFPYAYVHHLQAWGIDAAKIAQYDVTNEDANSIRAFDEGAALLFKRMDEDCLNVDRCLLNVSIGVQHVCPNNHLLARTSTPDTGLSRLGRSEYR